MATLLKWSTGDKRGAGRGAGASPGAPIRQPSRWLRNLVALAVLVVAGLLVWNWSDLRERTRIGSAYAARIGCVCRYVSQREFPGCEADLSIAALPGVAGMVSLSDDAEEQAVTAGLPLLGHQTARYDKAYGCRLDPWED